MEVDFQPEMIGRDAELKELEAYLEEAAEGRGNTIFISGEAGIGKTRLVNEFGEIARSRGFQVLTGYSMYESLSPYMPFYDALRSGGLDFLFEEESPRVEAFYLITKGGKLIKEVLREETDLNPDIFTSMLTVVSNFVSDSLAKLSGEQREEALRGLSYGEHNILIEAGEFTNLVVILKGKENEFLVEDMREVLSGVKNTYGDVLKDWDGDEGKLEEIEKPMLSLIRSGKYDGVYYGKEDPKARRNLLFDNVCLGLIRQASSMPILLCLEDMHWADPSSMALVHYVARNARDHGVLILGTYRPEDVAGTEGKGHPLVDTMQRMDREDLHRELRLNRLSEEDTNVLLSAMLENTDFGDDFTARVFKETEGNPLFTIQLVKYMVDEGLIVQENGRWNLVGNLAELDIPSKIFTIISRRLAHVDRENRRILDCASVVGDIFASAVLSAALDMPRIDLLEQLRTLEKDYRLIRSYEGKYVFDHAKIREVLYGEMPDELRLEYHSSIAGSLESLNEDNLEQVVEDLAHHYYCCKSKDKALVYLRRAAEKAKKEYSNEEAIGFYGKALELEDDRKRRIDILETIGDINRTLGKYDQSMESYEKALELAETKEEISRLKSKTGIIFERKGELERSLIVCEEAWELVKDEESIEEQQALHSIGVTLFSNGEYDRAGEYHERALAIARRIGNKKGMSAALNSLGNVCCTRSEFDKALEYYDRSLSIDEEMGDRQGVGNTLINMGIANGGKSEFETSIDCLERGMEAMVKTGDQKGIAVCLTNRGNILWNMGKLNEALNSYERAVERFEKIGDQQYKASAFRGMGRVYTTTGDYERAIEQQQKSLGICTRIHDQLGAVVALERMADAYREMSQYDNATESLEKALEIDETVGNKRAVVSTLGKMAQVHLKKGELEKAYELCKNAQTLSEELTSHSLIADFKKTFGIVCKEKHLWNESEENFVECIRTFKRFGMKKEVAESYYEFGLMWKMKDDYEKASSHLDNALEIFRKLKLDYKIEEVNTALDSLER